MDVTFETVRGRRFTVEVWYFATVREMKEKVNRREGIPVESQRLFLNGHELYDAHDTEHYSILQGSRLLLLLPDDNPSAATAVRIVVSVPAIGRSITLEMRASDTVARIKEALQDRTDGALLAASTVVFFDKEEMEDGKTLAEYNPPMDGMDVCVVVRQPPTGGNGARAKNQQQQRMIVKVKLGAQAVALEVGTTGAVRDLRREVERVAPHLHLPERNEGGYFFVYKQNVMEEERTLRWYEVKNGDTIEIFNGSVVTAGA